MIYSTRLFAFYDHGAKSIEEALCMMERIPEMKYVDFNYPEHFDGLTTDQVNEMLERHGLQCYGVSMRFRNLHIKGDYSNPDKELADLARQWTHDAVDTCLKIHGQWLTIYVENDGFDYSFQKDYAAAFNEIVRSIREGCEYAISKGLKVSYEYKPYEPRNYNIIDSFGMSMYLLDKVGIDELGLTLDYCHMLMKKEHPACGLAIALDQGRLQTIHLNDGRGTNDDGHIVGSCDALAMLEFIYYLKKYQWDGMVFLDTFPVTEDPVRQANLDIRIYQHMWKKLDEIGMDRIEDVIKSGDAIEAAELFDAAFLQ